MRYNNNINSIPELIQLTQATANTDRHRPENEPSPRPPGRWSCCFPIIHDLCEVLSIRGFTH